MKFMEPNTGFVGAGLWTPGFLPVLSVATLNPVTNQWSHAEKNLLDEAKKDNVPILNNSVVYVSLSPCIKELKPSREHIPCVTLLSDAGVENLVFGALNTDETEGIIIYYNWFASIKYEPLDEFMEIRDILLEKNAVELLNDKHRVFNRVFKNREI